MGGSNIDAASHILIACHHDFSIDKDRDNACRRCRNTPHDFAFLQYAFQNYLRVISIRA